MATYKEIHILLLTGYLGSGKTTLLNRILNNRRGIRFAVIVNDIGEVNIDADLIQQGGVVGQGDESLVALQNGCICCTLKMDLVKQLCDITAMHRFDYIVIEASGICEPGPIAQTICSIPTLGPAFVKEGTPRLDCIVTVVDALRMLDEFECGDKLMNQHLEEDDIENLVIQQIEFCNLILLNKVSELSEEQLGKVKAIVRALQPKAEIITCDYCDVDLDRLLNTELFDFDSVAASASWIQEVEGHHDDDDDEEEDEHHHGHEHHHHHDEGEALEYGIETFVYYRRRPFDINKFDFYVGKNWPRNVIRAKGICYFEDEYDSCYIFEQAGRQMSLRNAGDWFATMPADELRGMMERDANLRRDWDPTYGDRMQKLVFIGQHLDREAITRGLDFCLV